MQLHWDGNNVDVEERNKSAAFGTGTTPPTIDLARDRAASRSGCSTRSRRSIPSRSIRAKAQRGDTALRAVLRRLPWRERRDFTAPRQQYRVRGHEETRTISTARRSARSPDRHVGTDRHRLDSYHLRPGGATMGTLYAGYPYRFCAFPQDLRLRQHAARRPLAARAVSAQRLGADAARSARAGRRSGRRRSIAATTSTTRRRSASSPSCPSKAGEAYFPFDTASDGQRQRRPRGQGLRHRALARATRTRWSSI